MRLCAPRTAGRRIVRFRRFERCEGLELTTGYIRNTRISRVPTDLLHASLGVSRTLVIAAGSHVALPCPTRRASSRGSVSAALPQRSTCPSPHHTPPHTRARARSDRAHSLPAGASISRAASFGGGSKRHTRSPDHRARTHTRSPTRSGLFFIQASNELQQHTLTGGAHRARHGCGGRAACPWA